MIDRVLRLRSLLLLCLVLAFGGAGLGARTAEFTGTQGEYEVSQEATHTRRHSICSRHLQQRCVREVEENRQIEPSAVPGLRWQREGHLRPEGHYLGPPAPSRAPPPRV